MHSSTDTLSDPRNHALAFFALALGSFAIGTSEFASMGILQLFAGGLHVDIPTASYAITSYALGVVIGAPLVTLAAARMNRRALLLALMSLFVGGNVLSAMAPNLDTLIVARFIAGLPQGAYFGAGAVVASGIVGKERAGKAFSLVMSGLTVATIVGSPFATFLGQYLGWRDTYAAVAGIAALALGALWLWVPRSQSLQGGPIAQELAGLRKHAVWIMMAVAALAVSSIFAVYTFIGPFVTDGAGLSRSMVPVALALFGCGMTAGNLIGGRLADAYPARGFVIGFGTATFVLAALAAFGSHAWLLLPALFAVGVTTLIAIPTIQVRLTRLSPESPTLMGAMNMASLNVANAIGASVGGLTIGAGLGLFSTVWAGFALTVVGLLVFGIVEVRLRSAQLRR
ncbi:MFS transporter [Paraburkholderia sp. BCC1884]|uniref:MFS transporter n=1 Tax=Paraburkholderia sp. BCC1884 TaxID=2562668 RepID=UPI001183DD67|nr:MFS transporter [Paraburkholderia sp. BCC1884]